MSAQLTGKIAIITGGSSGIGAKTAEAFVREGAKVVIAARRRDEGNAVAERLGANAVFRATDVTDEEQVRSMVQFCLERFGRLDCLFNNAGNPGRVCGIAETTTEDLDDVLRVHVRGVVLGMKYAAPIMKRQGSGSVINTASLAGSRSGFSSHVYSAAKAAIIHLSQCVAVELGESGVRVNSLSPGPIVTGIFAKSAALASADPDKTADKLLERFAELQPIHRAGMPDDVAKAAVFLASDASSFITGKDLVVDGGNVGGWQWPVMMSQFAQLRRLLSA